MLIEFKVTNYLSIREQQTLSMVAANADKSLPSNVIEPALPGISKLKFLKGAAIYGANASGKSNVIRAIEFLANFVKTSATEIKPGEGTGAVPFKLDAESRTKPSEFEITFVTEGVRYQYGVSVTPQRVTEEYLIAYPKGSAQNWFHRTYDEATDTYKWAKPAEAFNGSKELQKMTRPNSLFLSIGPQFNHPQLMPVFDWFRDGLWFCTLSERTKLTSSFSIKLLERGIHEKDIFLKNTMVRLLKSADFGVEDVILKKQKTSTDLPKPVLIMAKEQFGIDFKETTVNLTHKVAGGEPIKLDFHKEESDGTQRFFALIGHWLGMLVLKQTIFMDEIETSLHPILVRDLLKLLFENNPFEEGAQVIYTTHSPTLLDNDLVRRDQVWFTEKSRAGTTHLYPLTDYKPRKDEALAKGYLAGRYGAIPYLPNGLLP